MVNQKQQNGTASLKKQVLLISFYFPPFHKSSGSLRILKFAKYLPQFGFEPRVLTASTFAYEKRDNSSLQGLPVGLEVHRAFALDAKRHLSFRGKYPQFVATPDRYASWIVPAILLGLRLVYQHNIDLIFSSSPTLSNHIIGRFLSRITGKPWIADFRDPGWDGEGQDNSLDSRARKMIEGLTFKNAAGITLTTNRMRELYLRRYAKRKEGTVHVIENGFDDPDFQHVAFKTQSPRFPIRFLHAGLLDADDRNPSAFFQALRKLKDKHPHVQEKCCFDLVAPGAEQKYADEIKKLHLTDLVSIKPAEPYKTVLQRMAKADVLLLFQGESCDLQVPAKLYEYFRIGKPVLALTTHRGETAQAVNSTGAGLVVSINDVDAIAEQLEKWIRPLPSGKVLPQIDPSLISAYSRERQSDKLASVFYDAINRS